MGVGDDGVDGVLEVVDGIAVESLQIVAHKHVFGYIPIGLAFGYLVDVAMIVVRQFVERNVEHIVAAQSHYG